MSKSNREDYDQASHLEQWGVPFHSLTPKKTSLVRKLLNPSSHLFWAAFIPISVSLFCFIFIALPAYRLLGFLFGVPLMIAIASYALSELRSKVTAKELLETDIRPPILLLRSFSEDYRLEKQLAPVFLQLGPTIAVGWPKEEIAKPGFGRIYLPDQSWQDDIKKILSNCRLAVIILGKSPGLVWELNIVLEHVPPERILLITLSSGNLFNSWLSRLAFSGIAGGGPVAVLLLYIILLFLYIILKKFYPMYIDQLSILLLPAVIVSLLVLVWLYRRIKKNSIVANQRYQDFKKCLADGVKTKLPLEIKEEGYIYFDSDWSCHVTNSLRKVMLREFMSDLNIMSSPNKNVVDYIVSFYDSTYMDTFVSAVKSLKYLKIVCVLSFVKLIFAYLVIGGLVAGYGYATYIFFGDDLFSPLMIIPIQCGELFGLIYCSRVVSVSLSRLSNGVKLLKVVTLIKFIQKKIEIIEASIKCRLTDDYDIKPVISEKVMTSFINLISQLKAQHCHISDRLSGIIQEQYQILTQLAKANSMREIIEHYNRYKILKIQFHETVQKEFPFLLKELTFT